MFCPGHRQIFSIIIISHDLSNVKSIWQFFFASNFEPCACAAIGAVSNFHISWKLQLQAGRRLSNFQADGSCNPCQILYVARSCDRPVLAHPSIKLEHKHICSPQKFDFIRKIIIIIIIIIPLLLYYIFKNFSNFFRA